MTRYFNVLLGVVDGRPCVRTDGSGAIAGTPFHLERYDDGSWTAFYDPFAVPAELTGLAAALVDSAAAFGLPYHMPTPPSKPYSPWRARLLTLATATLVAGLLLSQLHGLFVAPSILAAVAPVVLPIVALLHARRRQRLTVLSWLALLQVPIMVLAGMGATLWLIGRYRRAERWMRPSGKRLVIVAVAAFLFLEVLKWLPASF